MGCLCAVAAVVVVVGVWGVRRAWEREELYKFYGFEEESDILAFGKALSTINPGSVDRRHICQNMSNQSEISLNQILAQSAHSHRPPDDHGFFSRIAWEEQPECVDSHSPFQDIRGWGGKGSWAGTGCRIRHLLAPGLAQDSH